MRMTVEIILMKITAQVLMTALVTSFNAMMERVSQLHGSVMVWMIVQMVKMNRQRVIMMGMEGEVRTVVGEFLDASLPDAKVLTPDKNVTMDNLKIGTPVLVLNEKGKLTYSPVIAFLDNSDNTELKYITIQTEDGTEITLTCSHLIYKANHGNSTQLQKPTDTQPIFASKVKINDYIFTRSSKHNEIQTLKVVKVSNTKKTGAYAPLTLEGTIIVDNALASCYAVIDDHRLAHTTLAPLRLLYHSMPRLAREREGEMLLSWYPRLLETVGRMVLDETHFHHSTVKRLVREV